VKERRKSPPPQRVAAPLSGPAATGSNLLKDPRTGVYNMLALHELLQYEIDGGAQTEANELFVTPLCLAAIAIDGLESLDSEIERGKLVEVTGQAIARGSRKADRLARQGNEFVVMLRRTLAKRTKEFWAPHLTAAVAQATREAGFPTTLSFGIASLTEHLVRGPGDMVKKALTALAVAKQRGPGSVVVYDLREMPYD